MNPFRFVPAILALLIAGEIFQVTEGLYLYERFSLRLALLGSVSAVLHLGAFYLMWLTAAALREAVLGSHCKQTNHPVKTV